MTELEDICLAHVRRGVTRHDWRRFIRHDWERFLKPDWETRMPPGSSVAADMYHQLKAEQRRQWPAYYAQATPEEIAAEKAADEQHWADLAELRGMMADLKLDLLRREFARKAFNPNQPRVPPGNPDGGQRTNSGGAEGQSTDFSAARRRRFGSKPDGHHFVPHSLYSKLPLPPETRKVIDEAKTGRLYSEQHRWNKEHDRYNDAVRESFVRFLAEKQIQPDQMTPTQAQDFVSEVKRSSDPRIRSFNAKIYMREIMYWLRRGPRPNE